MEKRESARQPSLREQEAGRLFALASEYHRRGRLDDAARGYARALAMNPNLADAWNNLGVALRAQRRLGAAVACYRRALALRPGNAGAISNLGNVLREMGRIEESVAEHRRAVTLAPDAPPTIYNMGLALRDYGRPDTALVCFDKALAGNPDYVDCHWDRSLTLLQLGRLKDGFAEYEWRWRLPGVRRPALAGPAWDGASLDGRTLYLYAEQGFGDLIQFVRHVRQIPRGGGTVIVGCPPELVRLFERVEGIDRVVAAGSRLPDYDAHAPLLSLPWLLGLNAAGIGPGGAYLEAPEMHGLHLPAAPGARLRVGVVWAGRPTHKNDRNRSCPFETFMGVLEVPGVAFLSLQKGDRAGDLGLYASDALVTDLSSRIDDFADTAAVISQLDLVIAVDTAVVHLAGAMDRPVWTLLPHAADWRWGPNDRTETPWYPSMRLFRQTRPGDWDGVITRVRAALAEMAG